MTAPDLSSIATVWWPVERIQELIDRRRALELGVDIAEAMDTVPTEISRFARRIKNLGIPLPGPPNLRGKRKKRHDPEEAMRQCLGADHPGDRAFLSSHKFNRMCELCLENS